MPLEVQANEVTAPLHPARSLPLPTIYAIIQRMSRPTLATVKQLFAISGNQCAFPGCEASLVINNIVTGEICHIEAQSPEGPRYDPRQTDEERHGFANLLLLCPAHHKVVDTDPATYTVEWLRQIKTEHEARHAGGTQPTDEVAQRLLQRLEVYGDISGRVAVAGGNAFQSGDISGDMVIGDKIVQQTVATATALHQLPPPPTDFTGREDELDTLRVAIEAGGVTISGLRGMGGIGKTRSEKPTYIYSWLPRAYQIVLVDGSLESPSSPTTFT